MGDAPCQKGDQTKPATEVAPAKELDLDSDDGKECQADGASLENDGDPDFLSLQEELSKRLGSSSNGAVNLDSCCTTSDGCDGPDQLREEPQVPLPYNKTVT